MQSPLKKDETWCWFGIYVGECMNSSNINMSVGVKIVILVKY